MKRVGEYFYPDDEVGLCKNHARWWDVENEIVPRMDQMRTVVQAGGAAGVWPIQFAKFFDRVESFEPNPELIECFEKNVSRHPNSEKISLHTHGLWVQEDYGELVEHGETNRGAWYFKPCGEEGSVYVNTIDSYNFPDVDLIQLDIEGAEFEALDGAIETIKRCQPKLCLEIKFTQSFYDRTVEDLYGKLVLLGYETEAVWSRDQLWKPRSQ
jgi:FkbM family methyltransferase